MAQKSEIINEIEALAVHCRPPLMDAGVRAGWLSDWCEDLQPFPAEAIRTACRKYRQGGGTKFPTSGVLIPMCREAAGHERPQGRKPEPWRPLDDAEYAALDLPAKIRHQQILAQEARRRAVKHAHGWDRNLLTAPDGYRRCIAQAEGHDAEAARLRGYLRKAPVAAE